MDDGLNDANVWASDDASSQDQAHPTRRDDTTSSSSSARTEHNNVSASAATDVLHAVAKALPETETKPYIDDLDPFAPSPTSIARSGYSPSYATTLGSVVNATSRLEILPNSDDSSEGEPSPTSNEAQARSHESALPLGGQSGQREASQQGARNQTSILNTSDASTGPQTPQKLPAKVGATGSPSTSFLGGMFRSMSGSGNTTAVKAPNASAAASTSVQANIVDTQLRPEERGASEKASLALASETPTPSHLPKPLASIASVFKSSSRPSSAGGSPQPQLSEKAGLAKGKERLKEEDREAMFDFNRFLEQMRSRSADPVAKYLRSFLKEFSRRTPRSTEDQIRVINDFLDFIAGKMRAVEPWKSYFIDHEPERAEIEFDMAMEAMEKLVMNRLWHLTFTPALDLSTYPGQVSATGDLERDQVLSQRIKLFSWIRPIHLDLPIEDPDGRDTATSPRPDTSDQVASANEDRDTSEKSSKSDPAKQRQVQGFLDFARRELRKINQYKAPRDKMICVLNCCKVIFGLIRHVSSDEGADTFIPFLIYVVLKTNPEHLVSNIQYIQRFRNPDKLTGEGGYYLSSLNGALSFIETVDASALSNITQQEFEQNVAQAVRELPRDPDDSPRLGRLAPEAIRDGSKDARQPNMDSEKVSANNDAQAQAGARPPAGAELTEAAAVDPESPTLLQQPGLSLPDATKAFLMRSTDSVERMVSKPLTAIGRIFEQFEETVSDLPGGQQALYGGASPRHSNHGQGQHPLPPLPASASGSPSPGSRRRQLQPFVGGTALHGDARTDDARTMYVDDETPSVEVSERIERQHEQQRQAAVETLKNVFPNIEAEVLEVVLLSNGGDMSKAIDALLEMS
ncbi:hypothetical protein OIO90_002189 [Microbotryomycetes sp. JL221]|nr:hypothetical protein OIO90_002189 [Microbotryomycetes sp. JL221]